MFIWYIYCHPSPHHPGGWQTAPSSSGALALMRCNESIFLIPGTIPVEEAFA